MNIELLQWFLNGIVQSGDFVKKLNGKYMHDVVYLNCRTGRLSGQGVELIKACRARRCPLRFPSMYNLFFRLCCFRS